MVCQNLSLCLIHCNPSSNEFLKLLLYTLQVCFRKVSIEAEMVEMEAGEVMVMEEVMEEAIDQI